MVVYIWEPWERDVLRNEKVVETWNWQIIEILILSFVDDIGVGNDWNIILEVFLTGSEELFSPFLAGTLPDFL